MDLLKNFHRHIVKLQEFAGPQCHEDRNNHEKVFYNKIFRGPGADDPSKEVEVEIVPPVRNPTINPQPAADKFFLRRCKTCDKIRLLTERTAETYPLNRYEYGGRMRKVTFICECLYKTSCDEPEDIVRVEGLQQQERSTAQVAFLPSHNYQTCAENRGMPILVVFDILRQY